MDSTAQQFGEFEFNLRTRELRKFGVPIRLQDQPFEILAILLERPGDIVDRDELQKRLWPGETLVDVDLSLNSAIRKLRQALGDDSANPRYIQTLHGRGYRFIPPVKQCHSRIAPIADGQLREPTIDEGMQPRVRWFSGRNSLLAIAAAVVVAAIAVVLVRSSHLNEPKVTNFVRITNDGRTKAFQSLVTDGLRLYMQESLGSHYVIAQVAVGGGETAILPSPFGGTELDDVAQDGSALLVRATEETGPESSVWRLPLPPGAPIRLGNFLAHAAAWSPSTGRLVFSRDHALFFAANDGTNPRKLVALDGIAEDLRFSPAGEKLHFTLLKDGSPSLWQVNADGSGLKPLFPSSQSESDCCGNWTSDGRYFAFQRLREGRNDLWVLRERAHGLGDGTPVQLTNGPLDFRRPSPGKDGREIFAIGLQRRAELVRYDPKAGFTPYLGGMSAEGLSFSSDGQWVAYVSDPDGTLWKSKLDGTERIQLTHGSFRAGLPQWSPVGDRIAFMGRTPSSGWHAYLVSAAGGEMQELIPGAHVGFNPVWSADGKSIFLSLHEPFTQGGGISKLDLTTGTVSELPGSSNFFSQRCSPDGRFIAAITTDSRKLMLYSQASGKWVQLASIGNMLVAYPNWSRDGKYLYFEGVIPDSPALFRVRLSDHKLEWLVSLAGMRRFSGDFWQWSGLAPDDSLLLTRDTGSEEIFALEWRAP